MRDSKPQLETPIDPDPQLWLTPERRALSRSQFSSCAFLLRQSCLIQSMLAYWVRWQVSLEVDWPPEDEEDFINLHLENWTKKNQRNNICLCEDELRAKFRIEAAAARWSRKAWGHRLESYYLKRKSSLDRASCRILRLTDKNLAMEIYHRIKAGEISFEDAARQFGIGSESLTGGLFPLQPLERIPFGLAPLLERLVPGQLSMPLRLNSGFCLVQLVALEPSKLDIQTEELLLEDLFQHWVKVVVSELETDLI